MEKSLLGKKWHTKFWFVIITSFIFMLLLCFNDNGLTLTALKFSNFFSHTQNKYNAHLTSNSNRNDNNDMDLCAGRYIYVHDLPSLFNDDLISRKCKSLSVWEDMCPHLANMGFGARFSPSETAQLFGGHSGSNDSSGWFATNQFMLEVIFHTRMKKYECLTTDSTRASVVFVPFYAGMDVVRYLWGVDVATRDLLPKKLALWLKNQPEWKVMNGRDHFLVSGRIAWDFIRPTDEDSAWGNKLMFLSEMKNLTMLSIEASVWNNDAAIPYPTYFHPSTSHEVYKWQSMMREQKRRYLFSFAGAPRPNMIGSIRGEIINQCLKMSRGTCKLLDCNQRTNKMCSNPVNVINNFRDSVFCLQPPGDSFTRRSIFDSILAGCIPVFFNPRSAYSQYVWHLPKNYSKYSVFIPENDVKNGEVKIFDVLQMFLDEEIVAMREEVIRLIPKVIYANPNGKLEKMEDAFDMAIKGIIERVENTRNDISEGKFSRLEFGEKKGWNAA